MAYHLRYQMSNSTIVSVVFPRQFSSTQGLKVNKRLQLPPIPHTNSHSRAPDTSTYMHQGHVEMSIRQRSHEALFFLCQTFLLEYYYIVSHFSSYIFISEILKIIH